MRDLVVVGGRLALICAITALLLAGVNAVTGPRIVLNRQLALEAALASLVPDGKPGGEILVSGHDQVGGEYPVSGGAEASSILRLIGAGYGGDMEILAAYASDGTILAVELMDNQETPGLGKAAEKDSYMTKFIGTGGTVPVPSAKNLLQPAEADAITGATITFIGIAKALETGSRYIKAVGESR